MIAPKETKFRPEYYLRVYELAKDGMTDAQIAKALDVTWEDFEDWLTFKRPLRDAIKRGRVRSQEVRNIKDGLSEKQRRFAVEYVKDFNGSAAMRRAGYTGKWAANETTYLLSNPKVQEFIKGTLETEIMPALGVMREVSRIASFDPRKVYDEDGNLLSPSEWDDASAAAIGTMELVSVRTAEDGTETSVRKIKPWDKGKALDLLARCHGLSKDKVELSGPDGGPIVLQALAEIEGRDRVVVDAVSVRDAAQAALGQIGFDDDST